MKLVFALYMLAATAPALSPEARDLLDFKDKQGEFIVDRELSDNFLALPLSVHRRFSRAVDDGMISEPGQVENLLSLRITPQKFAYLLTDNCILCHTNTFEQEPETLFSLDPEARGSPDHLDLRAFIEDRHFQEGLSCSGCHGGSPDDLEMVDEIYERWPDWDERREDREWILTFCGDCHSDPRFIRRFNSELPTDQLSKYRTSHHGELLLEEGDSKAAQCVSCHTAHAIYPPNEPGSTVYPKNVPDTCGECHADEDYMEGYISSAGDPIPTDQVADYRESIHGKALFVKGDLTSPVCNDCHGSHAARPPEVSDVAQVCRKCHQAQGQLFDESAHKKAFREEDWPECEQCHGKHDIGELTYETVGDEPGDLCYECHQEYASDNTLCAFTSEHFGNTLQWMDERHAHYMERAEELAEKGLDVEPIETNMTTLSDALIQTRTALHSFELKPFNRRAQPGIEAVKEAGLQVEEAEEEFDFRRAGLTIALLITAFFTLMIYLKLRQVEKRDE